MIFTIYLDNQRKVIIKVDGSAIRPLFLETTHNLESIFNLKYVIAKFLPVSFSNVANFEELSFEWLVSSKYFASLLDTIHYISSLFFLEARTQREFFQISPYIDFDRIDQILLELVVVPLFPELL